MSTNQVCRFWPNGTCYRGASCKFLHEGTKRAAKSAKFASLALAQTGKYLETIDPGSLFDATKPTENVYLRGYEFLSSYNWADKGESTIYVPGAPPAWKPKELPFEVAQDKGRYFMDQNAARLPKYPVEPLFRSLAIMRPGFDMRDIDIVTDRNSLRKLLRFTSEAIRGEPFRIDIKLVGDVLFFSRWESKAKVMIQGSQFSGYGHNFERETTIFDSNISDSNGHHRVVRYNLGDIRCLVRYEADAYCEEFEEPCHEPDTNGAGNEDDLLDALKGMKITSTESMTVVNKGRFVQPSTIVELKTKGTGKHLNFGEVIPQLWFAQTMNVFVGYHTNGHFEEVKKLSVKSRFECWEREHQDHLRKLVRLIRKLKIIASTSEGHGCIAVCKSGKPLCMKIYESWKKGSILPEEIIDQYEWTHE